MKRLSIIAALAAATIFSGCKVSDGQKFTPTDLGYHLAISSLTVIAGTLDEFYTMKALDLYISADEAEREVIHDAYFYSQRIVERGAGQWQIIKTENDNITVFTGEKSLSETGAKWDFRKSQQYYGDNISSTIENITDNGTERYAVHSVYENGHSGNTAYSTNLTFTIEPQGARNTFIYIEGGGVHHYSYAGDYSYTVLSPLRFDDGTMSFDEGRLSAAITIDGTVSSPEAEISKTYITVWGGKDNAYTKTYTLY